MTSHLQQQRALTAQRVFLASDLAALVASFYLSYRLFPFYRPYFRPVVGVIHLGPFRESAWPLLLILPVWFVFLKSAGLYSRLRFSWSFYFWRLLRVHAAGLSSLAVVI